jgi:hypothetical protein
VALSVKERSFEPAARIAPASPQGVEALFEEVRRHARRRRLLSASAVLAVALGVTALFASIGGSGPHVAAPLAQFRGSASPGGLPITTAAFTVTGRTVTVLQWSDPPTLVRQRHLPPLKQAGDLAVQVVDASTGALAVLEGSPDVVTNGLNLLAEIDAAPPSGSVAVTLAPGSYRLLVTASGPWQISIAKAGDAQVAVLPFTWSGSGPEVIGPLAGGTELQLTAKDEYAGPTAFDAELYSAASGRGLTVALEEEAPFSGRAPDVIGLPGGPYYLGVFATGKWSITVTSRAS